MTCKELIDYLSTFAPEEELGLIVVDLSTRLHHETQKVICITDCPTLVLEVAGIEPLDEIMEE